MSLQDTQTPGMLNSLLLKATQQFENKASQDINDYANKVLAKNNLPSFSELKNTSNEAYANVMKNANWSSNLNESLAAAVPAANNLLAPGTAAAVAKDDKNSPNTTEAKKPANVPEVVLTYPLPGNDKTEIIPFMKIRGLKYRYDQADQLGNKSASEEYDGKANPDIVRTATINLPLPGNLASAIELEFDDYSSVFAKIVKSSGGMDISPAGLGAAIGAVHGRIKDANAYETGAAVGVASGIFAKGIGDATMGEATGVAFSEALNYIRVAAGIAVNPMQQASYVGSKIRHHAFEFNLVPRNAKEAMEVKKIIQTLQYHSIGARINELGGILTDYPSVWNVTFHSHDGKLINGMLSIPDSFITNVNVTYSPTRAGFTVTRDNDPFAYVLSLVFKEAQNLIRDDLSYIRQGPHLLKDNQPISDRKPPPDLSTVTGIYAAAGGSIIDSVKNAILGTPEVPASEDAATTTPVVKPPVTGPVNAQGKPGPYIVPPVIGPVAPTTGTQPAKPGPAIVIATPADILKNFPKK